MAGFWQFMYVRQFVGTETRRNWAIVEQGENRRTEAAAAEAAAAETLSLQAAASTATVAVAKAASTKRGAIATGSVDATKSDEAEQQKKRGKTAGAADEAAKATKKLIDSHLSKCKTLKARLDSCQSQHSEMYTAIVSERVGWKRFAAEIQELTEQKAKLDAAKAKSEFWQNWATNAFVAFSTWVKKHYTASDVDKEMNFYHKVEAAVSNVENFNKRLQNMHQASIAV
jgi:hypothetical protein